MQTTKRKLHLQDDFSILNHLPESSTELLEKLQTILNNSEQWKARMVFVDRLSGEYGIMVSGTNHQLELFDQN